MQSMIAAASFYLGRQGMGDRGRFSVSLVLFHRSLKCLDYLVTDS